MKRKCLLLRTYEVILQSSLRDLHSCPSCSSRSHLCWFSLRSMPYGLPEEVSRGLLRFPEFICILKVDFFLIKLAFQQTLKDRILHDDSWDFGRCMLITTSCQHSQPCALLLTKRGCNAKHVHRALCYP